MDTVRVALDELEDDKKLVENEVCVKETCSHNIMEIIKHNSAVTQALLQCLEKIMQDKIKICSVTSLLSKRDNVNSNCEHDYFLPRYIDLVYFMIIYINKLCAYVTIFFTQLLR